MPRRRPKDRKQAAASHYAAIAPRIEQAVPPGQRMALWRALAVDQAVTVRTLQRWYQRFIASGLDGGRDA